MRNDTWMRKFLLKCLFGTEALLGTFSAQGGWTLNGTTLSDGNGTLSVSASGGNYTVTGCSAGSGELDLRNTGVKGERKGTGLFSVCSKGDGQNNEGWKRCGSVVG